ncbi:GDSL-type esterase/lipase family protein [Paraglaciecola sp.]|uniref:GDSL-type esterase/lipase family protein n=1 Tax=Paraglaciecola sp. TaxID=1920173 RepID=UPI00273FA0B4|nr:GDSL-type esterase/lipase family protein [Paraglaciecola sp.]MDP5032761.1 GDSL-type esterase/lipase family protein [Paraglaciecola sp.]
MNKYLVLSILLLSVIGCGGQKSTEIGSTAPPIIAPAEPSNPPPTTPEPNEVIIEEMTAGFCTLTGEVENEYTGFTGEGYANPSDTENSIVKWQVNVTKAGEYTLELHYAAPIDLPATFSGNNNRVNIALASTTAWDLWTTDSAVLFLAAGENTITLSGTKAEGLPNIDSLTVKGEGLTAGACVFEATIPEVDVPTADKRVYVIGDSTVANYGASYYPQKGWGQLLQLFFKDTDIEVVNRARGGRSSRSYYTEAGVWDAVLAEINSGDYLLIQFGHNDRDFSKAERYTPPADYETYLTNYVNEARAKGAIPVLVSPMIMNAYNGDVLRNVFTETGNDYRGAMLKVATELNVPFIDLNMKSFELVTALGKEQASHYLYLILDPGEYPNYPNGSNDGTHFQETGAVEMARLIVEGLVELKDRVDIAPLMSTLQHRYELSVENVGANNSIITAGNAYPAGTPLTFKTIEGDSDTFDAWYNWGQKVTETSIYQTTMPASKYTVVAAFNGAIPIANFNAATLFIIGDSTVADYTDNYYPQTGWGQVFQTHFDDAKITVDNRALGGTSSKSFYENHWDSVKADISAGDFVFIQFGINDRSTDADRAAPTGGAFEGFLTLFAQETIDAGATPVFISSVRRNQWQAGAPYDAYHEHPIVTGELAETLGLAFIDLDSKNKALLEEVGEDYANQFYYMGFAANEYDNFKNGSDDTVHFQQAGAIEIARLVREGVAELSTNQAIAPLIDALQPLYTLTVESPTPEAGVFTKGYAYPIGSPLTVKALAKTDNIFTQWLDENSAQLSDKAIYQFSSDDSDSLLRAVFNNSEGLGMPSTNLVSHLDGTKVVLNWNLQNFDPAISYLELYRNDKEDTVGRTRIVAGAAHTGTFIDETAVEGTTYWYMFKVTQDTVTSNTAPEAQIRVPYVTEVPVTNLVAVVDGTAVELSWDLKYFDPDISYLELYRNDKNDTAGRTRIIAGAALAGNYRDEGLEPGKTYWYMFKMTQDGVTGNTAPEAESLIPNDALPTPPAPTDPGTPAPTSPVTNLTAVVDGVDVNLSWDLQNFTPDITYLELYRNDKNDTAGRTRIVAGASLAGTFKDQGLEPGKTYWYMFKMTQDGVTGNTAPEAESLIPIVVGAPSTNLTATVNGNAIELSWDLQNFTPAITAVEVYRNDKNDTSDRTRILSGAPLMGTFKDETAVAGTTYWYMFKLTQGDSTTNTTPEAETMIPPVITLPVTNLTTTVSGSDITVSWDLQGANPDITYLELYRNDQNGTSGRTRIIAGPALTGSYVDMGLVSGTTYWYMFKITQAGVTSNTAPEAEITIP